ncbi:MAG TPA: hypothetical protein VGH37_10465 [Candidatus Acidoferrum sp.]|jgi:hypothetical protein
MNIAKEVIKSAALVEVDALRGISDDQRAHVREIVNAHIEKQCHAPSVQGIANLVLSFPTRPTPNTFEANGKKI